MVIVLRILIFVAILVIGYWIFQYVLNPQRKLTKALENRQTVWMDDRNSVHRNLLLAYKGVLFEGEKYMGTTTQAFQITKIHIWARNHERLVGLQKEDFDHITALIHKAYPFAEISWRSPIKEFLQTGEKP